MINIGLMVAVIVLASAIHKYVEKCCRGNVPGEAEQRLSHRMDELERRLTDIQDVMIAIDEKLTRHPVSV